MSAKGEAASEQEELVEIGDDGSIRPVSAPTVGSAMERLIRAVDAERREGEDFMRMRKLLADASEELAAHGEKMVCPLIERELGRLETRLGALTRAAEEVVRARYEEKEWEPLKSAIAALAELLHPVGEEVSR